MNTTTTQICTRCPEKGEQPLSNFHKRRDGYQKICKACRNSSARVDYQSRGKSRKTTSPTVVNTNNFPAMSERIVALDSKLRAKAAAFAHDNLDADDIYSAMVEAILTRCNPENNDAYILQKASWIAQAYVAKKLSYSQYVEDLDVDMDESDGVVFSVGSARSVEDAMIQREAYSAFEKILKTLPAENQKVISLIAVGKSQKEIAAELHVSEQTISERVKKMRDIIRALVTPDMGLSFA